MQGVAESRVESEGRMLRRRFGLDERQFAFLGSPMDPLTMDETIAIIDFALAERIRLKHVVVNVAKLVNMRADRALHADVTSSDSDCGRSSDRSTSMSIVATSDSGADGSS